MKIFNYLLISLLIILESFVFANEGKPKMFYATSGLLFAESDLSGFPEESTWLGVYKNNSGFDIKEVKITIKNAPGEITNPNEGSTMGKRVFLSPEKAPLFLLKDVPGVRKGPVKSASIGQMAGEKRKTIPINYEGQKYEYKYEIRTYVTGYLQGGPTEDFERSNGIVWVKYRFVLSKGNKEQELFSNFPRSEQDRFSRGEGINVAGPKKKIEDDLNEKIGKGIIFAGDLDNDGKLDIVLDQALRGIYDVMYLSSFAENGSFVGKAGSCGYFDPNDPGCLSPYNNAMHWI